MSARLPLEVGDHDSPSFLRVVCFATRAYPCTHITYLNIVVMIQFYNEGIPENRVKTDENADFFQILQEFI